MPSAITLTGDQAPAPHASFTLNLALSSGLDTNPDETRADTPDAGWFNPVLSAKFTKPDLGRGFSLTLTADTQADLFTRDPQDVDETRINGAALLAHNLGPGVLTAGMRERVAYNGPGYSRFHYALERYVIEYAPKPTDLVSFNFSAEYRTSGAVDQRRWFSSASVTVTPSWRGLVFGLGQEFDLNIFRDPSFSGRHDVLSQSTFSVAPKNQRFFGPVQVELDLSFYHRFSNRSASVFSEFQIGPKLSLPLYPWAG